VHLDAGDYAVLSLIPGPDGVPGFVNGLLKSLTVVEASGEIAMEPTADVTISLDDFVFTVNGEFQYGKQMIAFENLGSQAHEMYLVKLNDGVTADDYLNAPLDAPPPAVGLGGITGIEPGTRQYVELDLESGNYAMFCFFPDAESHAPHFALGMMAEFSILADADAIQIVQDYYAALNNFDLSAAMTFISEEAVFSNPLGTYTGLEEIRGFLAEGITGKFTFELSNFRGQGGMIVYDYKVIIGGNVAERGSGGVTIVEDGLIVFDGTLGTLGAYNAN
jgi:hypothetical protein